MSALHFPSGGGGRDRPVGPRHYPLAGHEASASDEVEALRVAVVERDEGVRDSTCMLINAAGYCSTGYANVSLLRREAQYIDFDCVVINFDASARADLSDSCLEIDVPIVVLTSNVEADRDAALRRLNAAVRLEIPVPPDELLDAISRLARRASGGN